MMTNSPINLAILASGSGSNAEKIAQYFEGNSQINVKLLVSNKKEAGVFDRFNRFPAVKKIHLTNSEIANSDKLIEALNKNSINYIILAGFLLKIPQKLVELFPEKIINIHPALLPKYGGKGMYGHFVHEAVIENKESESGITIHQVNENYDEGNIIFQASCKVVPGMSPEQLAAKVQQLEHQHFPKVIEKYILDTVTH